MKTHILCSITFSEKHAVNMEKYFTARQATDDNIIMYMHTACWITKATYTHSKYVILIVLPQHEWLSKHTSMLC
jgi:hypothetical protein